jgi:hypothetical protein
MGVLADFSYTQIRFFNVDDATLSSIKEKITDESRV